MNLRITHYDRVAPGDLTPHPLNARLHTPAQQAALTALLESVGWVRHLVVNTRTGYVLNGHLRLETAIQAGEAVVPVAYVDLSEDEERLLLGLFDAVGALALTDVVKLETLLTQARSTAQPLQTLLDQMAREAGIDLVLNEDYAGDPVPERADVVANLGELRFVIDRDTFEAWRERLYQQVGMDQEQITAEIRRRLGL